VANDMQKGRSIHSRPVSLPEERRFCDCADLSEASNMRSEKSTFGKLPLNACL